MATSITAWSSKHTWVVLQHRLEVVDVQSKYIFGVATKTKFNVCLNATNVIQRLAICVVLLK